MSGKEGNPAAEQQLASAGREIEKTEEKVQQTQEKVAETQDQVAGTQVKLKDSADRRTELAGDRTVLAAERTYAAWVRTGLAALASGVGAQKLLQGVVPDLIVVGTGTVLVLFSAFCFGAAVWRQGTPAEAPDTPRIPAVLLLVVNAFLILVALAALIGIWFGRTGAN